MTEIDDKYLSLWDNLHMRWLVCAKEIKNDNLLSDDLNISKLIDIEKEIWSLGLEFEESGIELPESMKRFKPYIKLYEETIANNHQEPKNPDEDTKTELRIAHEKIKQFKKEKTALKIHRYKPKQMEMKNIIDRNRFINDKANCTKIGNELGIDPETAKRWIEKLGLSDYAFNPENLI